MIKQKIMALLVISSIFIGSNQTRAMGKVGEKLLHLKTERFMLLSGAFGVGGYLSYNSELDTGKKSLSGIIGGTLCAGISKLAHGKFKPGKLIKGYEQLIKGVNILEKINPKLRDLKEETLERYTTMNQTKLVDINSSEFFGESAKKLLLDSEIVGHVIDPFPVFFNKLAASCLKAHFAKKHIVEAQELLRGLEEEKLVDINEICENIDQLNYVWRGTLIELQHYAHRDFVECTGAQETLLFLFYHEILSFLHSTFGDNSSHKALEEIYSKLYNHSLKLNDLVSKSIEKNSSNKIDETKLIKCKCLISDANKYLVAMLITQFAIETPVQIPLYYSSKRVEQAREILKDIEKRAHELNVKLD